MGKPCCSSCASASVTTSVTKCCTSCTPCQPSCPPPCTPCVTITKCYEPCYTVVKTTKLCDPCPPPKPCCPPLSCIPCKPCKPCKPCYTPCNPCNPCNPCPPPCPPCLTYPTVILAQLNGSNEVPPNVSQGVGILVGVLALDNTRFSYSLQVSGLTGVITAAYFFDGTQCVNGPIVRNIPINGITGAAVDIWSNTDLSQPLTFDLVNKLRSGSLYVNILTSAYPAGEIRGQTLAQTISN